MHCPSCGNESSLDQKFCRQCGLSLGSVSKLVAEHHTPDDLRLEKTESEQDILRRMFRWMRWGCLVLLIGIVLLVMHRAFAPDKAVGLVALLLLLGGTAAATYGVLAAMRDGARLSKKLPRSSGRDELNTAPTTKELPGERIPVPVPSVTERTTQLIAADTKNGRGE